MDDDDVEMRVAIGKADFVGTCMRCGEPSTGNYDMDEDETAFMMKCVNCGFKSKLSLPRADNDFSFLVCGGDNG